MRRTQAPSATLVDGGAPRKTRDAIWTQSSSNGTVRFPGRTWSGHGAANGSQIGTTRGRRSRGRGGSGLGCGLSGRATSPAAELRGRHHREQGSCDSRAHRHRRRARLAARATGSEGSARSGRWAGRVRARPGGGGARPSCTHRRAPRLSRRPWDPDRRPSRACRHRRRGCACPRQRRQHLPPFAALRSLPNDAGAGGLPQHPLRRTPSRGAGRGGYLRARRQHGLRLPARDRQADWRQLRQGGARGAGRRAVRSRTGARGRLPPPALLHGNHRARRATVALRRGGCRDHARRDCRRHAPADLLGGSGRRHQSGSARRCAGPGPGGMPSRHDGGRRAESRPPLHLRLHALHLRSAHRRDERGQRRGGGRECCCCAAPASGCTSHL